MKLSKIYPGVALIAISGATYFISSFFIGEKSAVYSPREKMVIRYAQDWNRAAEYYHSIRANVNTGKVEINDVLRAREAVKMHSMKKSGSLNLQWSERGPNNVGGRTRAILIDKNNSNHVFAGSVSGGLFVSNNSASSWQPVNDQFENLIVSSLVQAPDGSIWMGTGSDFDESANAAGVLFPGRGLFKSTTGGSSFTAVRSTAYDNTVNDATNTSPVKIASIEHDFITGDSVFISGVAGNTAANGKFKITVISADTFRLNGTTGNGNYSGGGVVTKTYNDPNNSETSSWVAINKIAFKPGNSSEVYVAMNRGLRVSNDGGATWKNPIYPGACFSGVPSSQRGEDLDVTSDGRLFVSLGGQIYYSDNPMVCSTYVKVTAVPNPSGGRTDIAVAPSNSNYVYALVNKGDGFFEGVWKSTDKGLTWTKILFTIDNYFEPMSNAGSPYGQGVYDLAFAVAPNNENKIFIGGVQLWKYDGNLTRIAAEFGGFPPYYVHADKHVFSFDPNNPNLMYIGTDGGVFKSFDQGGNFFAANKGYNVTQFYAMAYNNPSVGMPTTMLGGSQDNGTQMLKGTGLDPLMAEEVMGGDGFDCDISSITGAMFGTVYGVALSRSSPTGGTFAPICGEFCTPPAGGSIFHTVTRLWESSLDVTSKDSILFVVDTTKFGIGTGNGSKKQFTGNLVPLQSSAKLVIGSLRIQVGTVGLTFNDWNNSTNPSTFTSGGNTCTIDYNTGAYNVTFVNAPSVNTPVWAYFTTRYDAGSMLSLPSNTEGVPVKYSLTQNMNYGDSITVQDPVQSLLALGVESSMGGVAITRHALRFNATVDTTWIKLNITGSPSCIEFSQDGNHMFYGVDQQGVWRVSGLNKVYSQKKISALTYTSGANSTITIATSTPHNLSTGDSVNISGVSSITTSPANAVKGNFMVTVVSPTSFTYQIANSSISGGFSASGNPLASVTNGTFTTTKIFSTNYAVTGISVDQDNSQKVVVTVGNYGHTGYVYRSTTAVSTILTNSFSDASGDLPPMPVYDSEFINHSPKVIIGTEYGIYSTLDIFANPVQWTDENSGVFPHMPVFEVRQQKFWPSNNYEMLFIGTHGRGMWQSGSLVTGITEPPVESIKSKFISDLSVFPNPMKEDAFVVFNLKEQGTGNIRVYDLNGRNVKSIMKQSFNSGINKVKLDAENLPTGAYFVTVEAGNIASVAKFVVVK